jgi:serine/threonine protein kinase
VVNTGQGVVLGTVGYMSPEQARGADVDLRSDQFALGVLLYEMTTGRHPFRKDTPIRTLSAILDAAPESIFTYSASAPVPLGWIIERCLAKNPDDRYGSTRDLARDLQALAQHLSGASGTLSVQAPGGRRQDQVAHRFDPVLPFVNAAGTPTRTTLATASPKRSSTRSRSCRSSASWRGAPCSATRIARTMRNVSAPNCRCAPWSRDVCKSGAAISSSRPSS